jgi:hypothetical protein
MNRRNVSWLATMLLLALLAGASAPAFPAEPQAAAGEQAAEPATGAEGDKAKNEKEATAESEGSATVETILQQQEALLRGQYFSYEPDGRRDPFQSLFEMLKPLPAAQRPRGVSGMLVGEVDLKGIIRDSNGGNMAFFTGSDNKGYFLRVGDSVYDGKLVAIDTRQGAVTFRQQVDDPRMIKPYRDVVKRLVQQEQGEESTND